MVKSTESRKFARATKPLSRIQGIASHDDIPTELLDDHRALEPPDPIPNSAVKRRIADGSVGFPHVRVGHRQAPIPNPQSEQSGWGFVFAHGKHSDTGIADNKGCGGHDRRWGIRRFFGVSNSLSSLLRFLHRRARYSYSPLPNAFQASSEHLWH